MKRARLPVCIICGRPSILHELPEEYEPLTNSLVPGSKKRCLEEKVQEMIDEFAEKLMIKQQVLEAKENDQRE